ncbi:glycosyltransferase family 2 protein [Candidatus Falkowbacteria bacterium]|nr:glycosyltransferase family 2 protein [Candidatus Falkowbacteria bacterium]
MLSIITVSWNVKELVKRMIDSIFCFTTNIDFEIIVVDNDSKDGTVDLLRQQFKEQIVAGKLKIIANDFNAGFSKANNQCLQIAKGDFILFMNPDMELLENSFEKLINFMNARQDVDICTCRLLYADKTIQPNIKNNPTLFSQILVLLKLHHFFKNLPVLKSYFATSFDYSKEQQVQQIMGAFVFTKRDAITKLKGWAEQYWLLWEDVDLCKRSQQLNMKIKFTPITEIVHYEGKSFAQTFGTKKQKRFNRGMLIYFKKYHSIFTWLTLIILQPISLLLTLLTQLFKIKPRTQSRNVKIQMSNNKQNPNDK